MSFFARLFLACCFSFLNSFFPRVCVRVCVRVFFSLLLFSLFSTCLFVRLFCLFVRSCARFSLLIAAPTRLCVSFDSVCVLVQLHSTCFLCAHTLAACFLFLPFRFFFFSRVLRLSSVTNAIFYRRHISAGSLQRRYPPRNADGYRGQVLPEGGGERKPNHR